MIIVAILSAVLAAVLDAPLLYLLAFVLLLAAVGLWVMKMKGRFDVGKPDSSGYSPVAEEDLSSYGILEIRPKARNGSLQGAPAAEDENVRATAEENAPATREERAPATREERAPATREERAPATREENAPGTREQSAPAKREEDDPGRQGGLFEGNAPVKGSRQPAPEATRKSARTVEREPAKASVGSRLEAFAEANHRSSPLYQMISVADGLDSNILGPCLESLASALKANTVVLISRKEGTSRILAIVSQNAYARGGGILPVTSVEPFTSPGKGRVKVEVVGDSKWDAADLKYYRGEIVVRETARVGIEASSDDEEIVLLADSVKRGVLAAAQPKHLLKQYARLVATLLGFEVEEPAASAVRPRREIIGEEMDAARSEGYPLGLALVLLNRADDFQDPDLIAEAEAEIVRHIAESIDGLRVEKFGDLMLGVFHRSGVGEVESWAASLQARLANSSGLLSGGVSVGVAMMTDRHVGPEELRADAATALQEAVESGACTILE